MIVRPSLNHPLLILVIALLLSIVFYCTQLYYTSSINSRSSRIYEQSLVASISQHEYLPALMAEDQTLRDVILDPNSNHLTASQKLKFIAQRSGADAAYLMDISGSVRATSNYDSPTGGFLYQNYSFRPYFSRAIKEKSRQFYYAKGATTGIPGFFIAAPIINNEDAIGVAVVKLELSHWEQKWAESRENIVVADKNNVAILSSTDDWRYRTIGTLSKETLLTINEQQQFSGREHTSLFSKSINIGFSDAAEKSFWLIDKKVYLVNSFQIGETGWTLYYLVKHDAILMSSLIFFLVISLLTVMMQLIVNGRKNIIESKNRHRLLEIKRREELQTVMDNIHIGVILFSESGILLSANEHAENLLLEGESFEQNHAININQLIDLNNKKFDELLLENITAPAYHETNATYRGKPSIPVMFAISKVNTMDQDIYLMTIINIKRRKDAENQLIKINENLEEIIQERTQELQETQKKLMQKNKAAALGNMAATIVHELSQPLTAMNSSIAAINAKIKNNDWSGVVDSAGRLSPLSKKMHDVIKLLKFFSYQDRKSYEIIHIDTIIQQILENLNDTLQQKRITINKHTNDDELYISANPLKIDLVISNIIQNAIDALEKTNNPSISISTRQDGEWAHLSISDNAGGVDKKIIEKLFSPYFTTKEVGKGLGLGLAITYEIIQEYGGNISVENNPQGAQFTITLPLAEKIKLAATY
jgi:two-component system C4-dicarboxylate transport sensor histidine kinase DctB